jgi:hypothetical protein
MEKSVWFKTYLPKKLVFLDHLEKKTSLESAKPIIKVKKPSEINEPKAKKISGTFEQCPKLFILLKQKITQ